MGSTVIIGLGNPVLADDSVGLRIAAELRRRLAGRSGFTTVELYSGGMWLMEAMAGHERAIVIDAIVSGGTAGAVYRFGLADLPQTRTADSTHDASLPVALELGRVAGLHLPGKVKIWAVEAADVETFSERLTPEVERAVPLVVEQVLRDLDECLDQPLRKNQ
ncbi:MAG: hydrogenase maturation protease [Candidatus Solibacter sp.]|nr:hydrogenase maturation protease [Candidatus Solibacter sp.]